MNSNILIIFYKLLRNNIIVQILVYNYYNIDRTDERTAQEYKV